MHVVKNKKRSLFTSLGLFFLVAGGLFFSSPISVQALGGSVSQQKYFSQTPAYKSNDCNDSGGVNSENCGIIAYIVIFINVLSVLAGIIITASIAYGGIQYSMSGSDPQKVSAAKERIRNAIIALVLFIFGYALLNYLVPGGVL